MKKYYQLHIIFNDDVKNLSRLQNSIKEDLLVYLSDFCPYKGVNHTIIFWVHEDRYIDFLRDRVNIFYHKYVGKHYLIKDIAISCTDVNKGNNVVHNPLEKYIYNVPLDKGEITPLYIRDYKQSLITGLNFL